VSVPGFLEMVENIDFVFSDATISHGGTAKIFDGTIINPLYIERFSIKNVAIKLMEDVTLPTKVQGIAEMFYFELAVMHSLQAHPNIIKLVGYSNGPMSIIMKKYRMDLKMALRDQFFQPDALVCMKIAVDVARGMEFVHKRQIIHLDLKPRKSKVLIEIQHFILMFRKHSF
jgi:serine/threonine protein kinase